MKFQTQIKLNPMEKKYEPLRAETFETELISETL